MEKPKMTKAMKKDEKQLEANLKKVGTSIEAVVERARLHGRALINTWRESGDIPLAMAATICSGGFHAGLCGLIEAELTKKDELDKGVAKILELNKKLKGEFKNETQKKNKNTKS